MNTESNSGNSIPLTEAMQRLHNAGWRGAAIVANEQLRLQCVPEGIPDLTSREAYELRDEALPDMVCVYDRPPEPRRDDRQVVSYEGTDSHRLARVINFLLAHGVRDTNSKN